MHAYACTYADASIINVNPQPSIRTDDTHAPVRLPEHMPTNTRSPHTDTHTPQQAGLLQVMPQCGPVPCPARAIWAPASEGKDSGTRIYLGFATREHRTHSYRRVFRERRPTGLDLGSRGVDGRRESSGLRFPRGALRNESVPGVPWEGGNTTLSTPPSGLPMWLRINHLWVTQPTLP